MERVEVMVFDGHPVLVNQRIIRILAVDYQGKLGVYLVEYGEHAYELWTEAGIWYLGLQVPR